VAPVITILTDYGTADEFVGIVHGVIARISPEARIIDLTHGVPRHAIEIGARVLVRALPFMPAGVHLAVVDPEVGAMRRAVALRLAEDDRFLVGPDNGLLMPVAERFGGVEQAVEISNSPWRLEPVSATFHGRDVFAPVAARLAAGEPLRDAGEPLEPGDLTRLQLSRARRDSQGNLVAHAVDADAFGNVTLDAIHEDVAELDFSLGQRMRLTVRDQVHEAVIARTFADAKPGDLLLYEDSSGALALAVNAGSAQAVLGLRLGEPLTLST
jgi:S-adenosyl-L-methionine hydrolase (adenosine-forming)